MAHWHALFPGRILDVDYAQLTADPEATMREVAAFCGIEYVDSDARSAQQFARGGDCKRHAGSARRDESRATEMGALRRAGCNL